MALVKKQFSEVITMERAGSAWCYGPDKVYKEVAANLPRLDHDPVTGAPLGILVEESRTNLRNRSNELENSVYSKTEAAVLPFSTVAPDGSLTARRLVVTSANNPHGFSQLAAISGAGTYTWSVFVKAAGLSKVRLGQDTGQGGNAIFDLQTKTATKETPSETNVPAIVDCGNGWFRCCNTFTATAATSLYCRMLDAAGNAIYQGDGVSGLHFWGVQLEQGSFPTSHIPTPAVFQSRASTATYIDSTGTLQTAAAGVARDNHHVYIYGQWVKAGLLLEGQATNLVTYASTVYGGWKGVVVETSGQMGYPKTSQLIAVADTVAHSHLWRSSYFSITTGQTVTLTAFVKVNTGTKLRMQLFGPLSGNGITGTSSAISLDTVTGQIVGKGTLITYATAREMHGGFWQVSITATADQDGASSYISLSLGRPDGGLGEYGYIGDGVTVDLEVLHLQAELGAIASSPILTSGAQVTRAADITTSSQVTRAADVVSVNNLAPWYRADEGTLFAEFSRTGITNSGIFRISGGTGGSAGIFLETGVSDPSQQRLLVRENGTDQAQLLGGNGVVGTVYKLAGAYKENDFAASQNGGAPLKDTAGILPYPTTVKIGQQFNGHIKSIRYYPKRLPDAELQTLTTA